MISPDELLASVASFLDECNVPYMIVGSFASNLHGMPRATLDADIVVEIDEQKIDSLGLKLGRRFYLDTEAAKKSLFFQTMFNAVHIETAFKIDFLPRKRRDFSKEEFRRRGSDLLAGRLCFFATAEDTVLSKLEWSKKGQSERQFLDAVNVVKLQRERLDFEYLRRWAADLGIQDFLEKALHEIDRI
jgi:hypothetical protein